jgi:hypothetical protein
LSRLTRNLINLSLRWKNLEGIINNLKANIKKKFKSTMSITNNAKYKEERQMPYARKWTLS